ncbi:MAG: hypothetical protein CL874_01675 [Dehalococcoidales bacterium]|jgi:ribulose-5-phosphate 4-epimerase/fuculose-1-phosphate aldolase|nr:hypothetical protein [Dehalococcoidales bacterium]MDP6448886.1 hypothetical protein [Dehalococcoidales bacterium]MDP6577501.1 hypothetical protein [Dehalococcoidales bacterium]MDP6825431.1 hypothetical protein [Dehalococcoidales bacterium]
MAEISLGGELQKIVRDIAAVAGYLWEKGWATRNAGNISVDITELVPQKRVGFEYFPKVLMENIPSSLAGRFFWSPPPVRAFGK